MTIALRTASFAVVLGAGVWAPRLPLPDEHAAPDLGSAGAARAAAARAATPAATIAALVAAPRLAPQTCGDDEKASTNITSRSDDDDRRTTVRWSSKDCAVELRAGGKFVVRGDLSDFESVSRGGWVALTEERGGTKRELRLRERGGALVRTYRVNGSERAWDDDGRRWLAAVLLDLERRTAFAAEQRVPRLLAQGGPGAVIEEVARMRGDYASHVYLAKMFQKVPTLDAPLVRRVLQVAGERVSSDYYRYEVLKVVARRGLPDDESHMAYVTAAGGIGSDYYRYESLLHLLGEGARLTRPVGDALLRAAAGIGSDYYASEALKRAAARGLVRPENRESFFEAVRGVGSDYYRAEILLALLRGDSLDESLVSSVVAATEGIASDHYAAEVLLATARRHALAGETRAAYVKAANGIKSDHYHRRVMSALVKQSMAQ